VRIADVAHTSAWGGPLTDLPPLKLAWTRRDQPRAISALISLNL
jgi:hypothetical protein